MGIRKIEIEKVGRVGKWNGIAYEIRVECKNSKLAEGLRKQLVQHIVLDDVDVRIEENIVIVGGCTDLVNGRFVNTLNRSESRIEQILSVVKETVNELDKLANYKEKRIVEMGEEEVGRDREEVM